MTAPKPSTNGIGIPPDWHKPSVALVDIVPPERRAMAVAYRWLTMQEWGDASADEQKAALELIRQSRRVL